MQSDKEKYNLSDLLLSPDDSLLRAIKAIDDGNVQIALVVNHNGFLIGTVTDGDVRRALLHGGNFDAPVESIMNKKFFSLPESATNKDALALMRRETLHQIPALDEAGKVIKLFLLEDLITANNRPNSVVIMAGGEGKRLRPLTNECPKPMLRVGEKPLLEIIIEQCIEAGLQNFYLAVNYLKEQIKSYFADGSRWNIQINYLEEISPLGTAGALSLLPEIPREPLLVLNGDVLTRINFESLLRFHQDHNAAATLCVREHSTQIPYGVVETSELNVLRIDEKPFLSHYVNAGIYLLDPTLIRLAIPNEYLDMPNLLQLAMESNERVLAFPIHEYWLDVGHPGTLDKAFREWPQVKK